ncbi:MAG: putative metal-binding motif-containing protein, partial [Myxococcota bacterium]
TDSWYDGVDSNCDGRSDYDKDGDGYDAEAYGGDDCDDESSVVRPGGVDVWYDGLDSNCDDRSDYDQDGDGYDATAYGGSDCNDTSSRVNPGATETWYDGVDGNCDGESDYDQDGDGHDAEDYGGDDCVDTDARVFPDSGGDEIWYDGIDGDCDGMSDYDQDADGFDAEAYGGDDCDDLSPDVHPYRWESTNGIDDDCDGGTDTGDTSTVVYFAAADDTSYSTSFSGGFTFPFCGTSRTSAYMSTNGLVSFTSGISTYTESSSTFGGYTAVAGLWDDLYPSSMQLARIQYEDAIGFYWNGVREYGGSGSNTFAVILHESGRVYLEYGSLVATDGLAGFSCGRGATTETDLTNAWANRVADQIGVGTGTDSQVHEVFTTSDNDLDDQGFWICANPGVDADGDGWSESCGDEDDTDRTVYPG